MTPAFAAPVAPLEQHLQARKLPALLHFSNGEPVQTAAQWHARRAEIIEVLTDQVYGRAPAIAREKISFKVTKFDPAAMNGTATLKQIAIHLDGPHGKLAFELVLFTPNKRDKPAPTFLLASHRGVQNLDPTRAVKTEFWPAEEIIRRGFGAAAFFTGALDPDEDDDFENGVHGIFDAERKGGDLRPADAWGTIAAWAWGASRALDYLQTDADVDGQRVAVIGHSRGGKTALWAGATDGRFALVVANCSGQTGAALGRGKSGESITQINTQFPHWLARNYRQYNDRPAVRPFDQHWLLASIAPRPLYVVSAEEDLWADPQSEFLSALAASPAYELLGHKGLVADTMPQTDVPLMAGKIGYHRRAGKHGLTSYDWARVMDFAQKQWGKPAQ